MLKIGILSRGDQRASLCLLVPKVHYALSAHDNDKTISGEEGLSSSSMSLESTYI